MKHVAKFTVLACYSLVVAPLFAEITTGWIQTGAGPYDYNDTENWANGVINGVFSSNLTLTAAQTITYSDDTTLSGDLVIKYNGKFPLTFESSKKDANDAVVPITLTLGGDIVMDTGVNDSAVVVNLGS